MPAGTDFNRFTQLNFDVKVKGVHNAADPYTVKVQGLAADGSQLWIKEESGTATDQW